MMKFANVRELKNKTSEILRKAEKESVIIMSRSKPRAVLSAISEEDFEDYLLEQSPDLVDALEKAAKEYKEQGGISLETYILKRAKKRGRV